MTCCCIYRIKSIKKVLTTWLLAIRSRLYSFLLAFHGPQAQLYNIHEAAVRDYQYTHSQVESEDEITAKWDQVFANCDFERATQEEATADKGGSINSNISSALYASPVTLSQFFAKLSVCYIDIYFTY